MPKLRVCGFSLSVDGPHQDTANPLGLGGTALHEWAFGTRTFQKMFGGEGGTTGVDDQFPMRGFETSARGSWGETVSTQFAVHGLTKPERDGGPAIPLTTRPSSC